MKATIRHRVSNVGFLRILTSNRMIHNGTASRWPWKVTLIFTEVAKPIALREKNMELALIIARGSVPKRLFDHSEANFKEERKREQNRIESHRIKKQEGVKPVLNLLRQEGPEVSRSHH